jgi:DNA helicase-2/ATP-dependent DNA helicase PcrA
VGMTRAMEQLLITSACERRRFGERSYQTPSRFLREIPEEHMEIDRASRSRAEPRARGEARSGGGSSFDYSYSQEGPDEEGEGIRPGLRVRHPVFGVGVVMSVSGADLNQKIKIKFERAGVKTVMVRYANLEPA